MADVEVVINEQYLNDIANEIRRKNGLVRTYKPSEMPAAIRAIGASVPASDGFTVTVIQTAHQTIKVKQFLGGEQQYDESFTVSEPFWKIQATIEAEAGYEAGSLNYSDEVTVDRDIIIQATPAQKITQVPEQYNVRYIAGMGTWGQTRWTMDDEMTNYNLPSVNANNKPQGRVVYHIYDAYGDKWGQSTWRRYGLFGGYGGAEPTPINATDITFSGLHLNGCTYLQSIIFDGSVLGKWLEYIDISSFNMHDVEQIDTLFPSSLQDLRSIGNIAYWDTTNLRQVGIIRYSSKYVNSLDLSHWNTSQLRVVNSLFPGGLILDISKWDTSLIRTFGIDSSIKYIIMDDEEIKFDGQKYNNDTDGGFKFGRVTGRKFLVPESMVDSYKQHPNWSHIADQIEPITNYTINRGNGEITVTPNW